MSYFVKNVNVTRSLALAVEVNLAPMVCFNEHILLTP